MVTIYDIAKACNCSSATVSKVFNHTGNISENKRREVLAAAQKMGYVPNVTARNLVKRRSNMVGVLLFVDESLGLRHELFAETLNNFRTVMEKSGYEIVLISEKGSQWQGRFLDHCRALRLDGVFCLCCDYDSAAVHELFESDIPVVGFESPFLQKPSIESKNFEASKRLTEYLIENGHREIVYLAGSDRAITTDRINGYRAALAEHGIPFREERFCRVGYYSNDHGKNAARALLACPLPYTAVMFPDDFTAIAAYRELAKAGIRVGEDISVTGFDGVSIGGMVLPRLATMQQDAVRIGKGAAQLLIGGIEGGSVPACRVQLDAKLLAGDSVKKI